MPKGMTRKDFLKTIGAAGGAVLLATSCNAPSNAAPSASTSWDPDLFARIDRRKMKPSSTGTAVIKLSSLTAQEKSAVQIFLPTLRASDLAHLAPDSTGLRLLCSAGNEEGLKQRLLQAIGRVDDDATQIAKFEFDDSLSLE
jgi:hypothetical protein